MVRQSTTSVKTSEIVFPGMGVVRNRSLERAHSAPDYPAPWGVNVRLEDSLTSRLRGGSWEAISAAARPSTIIYRDRLLKCDGNAVAASRQGSHTDFNLSADLSDTLRATLFQCAEAGEIGEDVVALVPHRDATLLIATAGELWVLRGNPTTANLQCVSREVGMVTANAWCKAGDAVYFLSSLGLYVVGADGSGLKPLSEGAVPVELTGVTDIGCTLTYNHADRGVYIHLPNSSVSWFYDTARNAHWPFDSTTTDSHILLGPLRIGGANAHGLLQTIHGIMAADSGTVDWRIVPGVTAEEAVANGKAAITAALAGGDYDSYVAASGAWGEGRSKTCYPRVRSPWIVLWLSSDDEWAYESVLLETIISGRVR